jgi:hypothetical protein
MKGKYIFDKRLLYQLITASSHCRSPYKYAEPRIHAMVYEPGTGILKKLDVDFKEYLRELGSVYDLYSVDSDES